MAPVGREQRASAGHRLAGSIPIAERRNREGVAQVMQAGGTRPRAGRETHRLGQVAKGATDHGVLETRPADGEKQGVRGRPWDGIRLPVLAVSVQRRKGRRMQRDDGTSQTW